MVTHSRRRLLGPICLNARGGSENMRAPGAKPNNCGRYVTNDSKGSCNYLINSHSRVPTVAEIYGYVIEQHSDAGQPFA
jgi:hypothetical protein